MEIKHVDKSYMSGGDSHEMEEEYDYMLFRQDWSGAEKVYFNKDEIEEVSDLINEGEILIHHNYSILYASTKELLETAPEFGCYASMKHS